MTLIELVIVMAIFGVLLLAVMSIADPVSKIFRNAESSEKTYAYTNNIETYLQNQLQYADNVVVLTADQLGGKSTRDLAEEFRATYYKDIVVRGGITFVIKKSGTDTYIDKDGESVDASGNAYTDDNKPELTLSGFDADSDVYNYLLTIDNADLEDGGYVLLEIADNGNQTTRATSIAMGGQLVFSLPKSNYSFYDENAAKAVNGKIYVMRLSNDSGQIYLYTYDFTSDVDLPADEVTPVAQLNEAYFSAGDAKYVFNYVLGAQSLTAIDPTAIDPTAIDAIELISGSNEKFKVINDDFNNADLDTINYKNLTISIIASKELSAEEEEAFDGLGYSVFKGPSSISAANIPLLNISFRASNNYVEPEYDEDGNISNAGELMANQVSMVRRWQKYWKVVYKTDSDGNIVYDAMGQPIELSANWAIQRQPAVAQAVDAYSVYDTIDATKDIYFVYAYADELTT